MGGTAALALTGAGLMSMPIGKTTAGDAAQSETYQKQMQDISRKQKADADKRLSQLAEVTATHRARVAAQGINPNDGSSAAVLAGLQNKTDQELQKQAEEYNQRRSSAQQSFADVQDKNLTKKQTPMDLLVRDDSAIRQLKNWG